MTFFTDLTASLRQKWLQYFQENRDWITRQMEMEYVETPDGGRRPSSFLILGVVSTLEPQILQLMVPFTRLSLDTNLLIDILELNFDPVKYHSGANPTPHLGSNPPENPDVEIDALMGVTNEEPGQPRGASWVEVVDRTTPGTQQPLEQPNTAQTELGDAWLDELNQETSSQSEQTPDKTHNREGKQSEDEEISRLFPEF